MDLQTEVKNALSAFEVFKTDISPILEKAKKLDAFDAEKLSKIEKDIGDATELQQKEAARHKMLEDQVKALELAINSPKSGVKTDNKELISKSFSDFLRTDASERRDFSDFIKQNRPEGLELKDLSVGNDANGGYLVLPQFGGIIQTKVYESSPLRQLANVVQISTDSYELVADYDETGASWVGEIESRSTTTTPAFGKLIIPANEMSISVQATQKILDDAVTNVETWLAGKVADKAARKEATAFISGTGINQPKGILTYTAGTTITSSQVEQVNTGSNSAFTYAGLSDLQNALKEPYQANAVFLMKRATFGSVMKIVDGQSRPIFNLMFDKNTGIASNIMGKPVYFADDMDTLAQNGLCAAYGDFSRAYTIVDRIGLRTLKDPYTNKPYVVFYTTKRVGGAVVNFEAFKIQKVSA